MLKLKTKTMKTKLDMHNQATKGEPLYSGDSYHCLNIHNGDQ